MKSGARCADIYGELFNESGLVEQGKVVLPYQAPECRHVFNQYTIRVQDRDRLQAYLEEKGSAPASIIHCPCTSRLYLRIWDIKRETFPMPNRRRWKCSRSPCFPN